MGLLVWPNILLVTFMKQNCNSSAKVWGRDFNLRRDA